MYLARAGGGATVNVDYEHIIQLFYDEVAYYNFGFNMCRAPEGLTCGHFTQVSLKCSALFHSPVSVYVCVRAPTFRLYGTIQRRWVVDSKYVKMATEPAPWWSAITVQRKSFIRRDILE